MKDIFIRFYEYHSALMDSPNACLLALVDGEGTLHEANPGLRDLLRTLPESSKLADAVVASSQPTLCKMLMQALITGEAIRETLHFVGSPGLHPTTYNCVAVRNSIDRLFFYAEMKPALDDVQAHEYAIVNSELSTVTRQLQKANYDLAVENTERKRAEEALSQSKAETEILNSQLEDALRDANQYSKSLEIAKGEMEAAAIKLAHYATHDALTGLPNRKYFEQHLVDLIKGRKGKKSCSMTVLFLDLDKFKIVNDTLGHKTGDMLLVEVAGRLQACLRSEDILARMGGDEFTAILSRGVSVSIVELVASRIIDSISRPFEIQGHRFVIGTSIGLASYPSDGTDAVDLLKHADAAMYNAKQSGRGTFCWFSGDVDVEDQLRASIEMDMRDALRKHQFSVCYQPILCLADGIIHAAEALLRWEHPEKGMISPSLFIPIAEEIGMIGQIGDYVLRTACAQTMAWRDEGMYLSQISVNISIRQLRDASWLDSVSTALSDTGLDAQCLNLEVTEADFATEFESIRETLRKVQELGICMSIDDFSIGQSLLGRLKDFPVIHLKIDGSFVRNFEHNKDDNAQVRSIVEMAHGQNNNVTAKWVETESQMEMLRLFGCDFAQGYLISPALPSAAFGDFVRQWIVAQRQTDAD